MVLVSHARNSSAQMRIDEVLDFLTSQTQVNAMWLEVSNYETLKREHGVDFGFRNIPTTGSDRILSHPIRPRLGGYILVLRDFLYQWVYLIRIRIFVSIHSIT